MALFFKRIRQKLLINKRFGKYSLYAIGEVLILIFGIAIAVQVNNWDQRRQNKIVEISILKSIKADLENDLEAIPIDISLHEEGIESSKIILDHLENNRPYNDSLSYHFLASFYVTELFPTSGGIQTLKSIGVNTISNESLRKKIIDLYDVRYTFMRYLGEIITDSYVYNENNILSTRFDQAAFYDDPMTKKEWDGGMVPMDYEGLKDDSEFKFHLKSFKNGIEHYLSNYYDLTSRISKIISDIDAEVNALEK